MIDIRDGTAETNSHWTQTEGKPIILLDFDHTITKKCLACEDKLENDGIQEGAKEAIEQLSKRFRIWIFTGSGKHLSYATPLQRSQAGIEDFLRKHNVPFEKVLQTKPPACFIIDDRAVHHVSWEKTIAEIEARMGKVRKRKCYVDFEFEEKKPKTSVYRVVSRNEGTILGRIFWYSPWRQYVFEPSSDTVWSKGCMEEVMRFLGQLMEDRKRRQ